MKRIVLGKTGLEVNRLGFGGIPIQKVGEKQAVETVLHALEKGVDFIDTARGYTTSEEWIGKALKQTERKVVVATKSHDRTADGIRADIDKSLKAMQRDKIELYQAHFVKNQDEYEKVISPKGALEGLRKARDEGLIDHIGVSSHSLDLHERIIGDGLFETIMVCYSFLESAAEQKIIPMAIEKGIGVIAMKPFSGGFIENPGLALKYVLSRPGIVTIPGVEEKKRFDENWDIFQGTHELDETERAEIREIRENSKQSFCRRCDYCLPCTADIPIQIMIGIRTAIKRTGMDCLEKGIFKVAVERAENCTECGECMSRCPYDLPIPELIKENLQWIHDQREAALSG
jgi:predicted aldo/keto reductase-like oxidoreductase